LTAAAFKQVFANPVRSADSYFMVLAVTGIHGSARLGLAISKKQARRAVDRNRLKRLTREVFRRHAVRHAGIDLVVMARSAALAADNHLLSAALTRHFSRLAAAMPHPGSDA
jgi:ribonuclease P protein component